MFILPFVALSYQIIDNGLYAKRYCAVCSPNQ